jgi:peroxiredoxin
MMRAANEILARIGGLVVAPRRTLRALLEGEGSALDIVPAIAIAAVASTPAKLGAGLLLLRARPDTALHKLGPDLWHQWSYPLLFVVFAATALAYGKEAPTRRCFAVSTYALVPSLLLMSIGGAAQRLGVDLAVLPHHPISGGPLERAARILVAFAPSVALVAGVFSKAPTVDGPPRARAPIGAAVMIVLLTALVISGPAFVELAFAPTPARVGDRAPPFSAATLQGGIDSLDAHRGEVVLLDFWATWCGPCVVSMPAIELFTREFRPRGFTALAIDEEPDDLPHVRSFVEEHELTVPVLVDPGPIARAYGALSFPTTILIGRDGTVHTVHGGITTESWLRKEVLPLLDAPPHPD